MEAGNEGVMELKEGRNNIEEEESRKAPTIRETRHEKVDSSIQPTQRTTYGKPTANHQPTPSPTNEDGRNPKTHFSPSPLPSSPLLSSPLSPLHLPLFSVARPSTFFQLAPRVHDGGS